MYFKNFFNYTKLWNMQDIKLFYNDFSKYESRILQLVDIRKIEKYTLILISLKHWDIKSLRVLLSKIYKILINYVFLQVYYYFSIYSMFVN